MRMILRAVCVVMIANLLSTFVAIVNRFMLGATMMAATAASFIAVLTSNIVTRLLIFRQCRGCIEIIPIGIISRDSTIGRHIWNLSRKKDCTFDRWYHYCTLFEEAGVILSNDNIEEAE